MLITEPIPVAIMKSRNCNSKVILFQKSFGREVQLQGSEEINISSTLEIIHLLLNKKNYFVELTDQLSEYLK